jgi:hypothetical protein
VPEVALDHPGHDQAHEVQYGLEVDRDLLVHGELVGGEDVPGAGDPGVVDQDVDIEAPQGLGEGGGVGDVDGVRGAARTPGEVLEPLGVPGDGVDFEPLLGQPLDDHRSDSGRGSCHQGGVVVGKGHVDALLEILERGGG